MVKPAHRSLLTTPNNRDSRQLHGRLFQAVLRKDHLMCSAFLYICYMKAIVVTPKSDNEFKFVADLLKKLGIGTSTLTKSEIEDIGMLKLMNNVDKSRRVSRNEIMKKLTA